MPTITLEKATKIYKVDKRPHAAVEDVDLTIKQGEFVFLIGSSGAGKSTLLNLITGGMKPTRGAVYLNDKNLQSIKRWEKNRMAQIFGQVWQEPHLIRKRTVGENLALVGRIGAPRSETPEELKLRVAKVLSIVGMAGAESKFPVELSIGESRRVELARAIINSPPILVLDEITGNLDDDNIWDIFHLLNDLNRRGTTIIMATHASQYVNIMRRRVVTIVDGHVFGDVKKGKYGDIV